MRCDIVSFGFVFCLCRSRNNKNRVEAFVKSVCSSCICKLQSNRNREDEANRGVLFSTQKDRMTVPEYPSLGIGEVFLGSSNNGFYNLKLAFA